MRILKKRFKEKKKDEFGEAYARTMASLLGNLKEMDRLLLERNLAFENLGETFKDINKIADGTSKLAKRYKEALEVISKPQN